MELDKHLRKMAKEDTTLIKISDTTNLEKKLWERLSKTKTRREKMKIPTIIAVCAFLIFAVASLSFFTQEHPSNSAQLLTLTDSQIKEKVDYIKKNLKVGQSQQEVTNILGNEYFVANDNGDIENGSDSFWKYRFYMEKGYTSTLEDHEIDEQGLRSRKVGVDLFIGWKDKRLYFYSISYVQGKENDLYFYLVNPDGSASEEVN